MVYVTQLQCIKIFLDHHYRPQRSCESYVFVGVFFNGGGGVCSRACLVPKEGAWSWGGAWSWKGGLVPGGCLGGRCLVPGGMPGLGPCLVPGKCLVPGGLVSQHALWQTPPGETATAADGTHPTGMHSCSFFILEIDFDI